MMMAWLATIAVGVGIYLSPPRPYLAGSEIVDLLATPTNDGLVVVWKDGAIAGCEFATRVACLPQAEAGSDHVMRRPSSAFTVCDAQTGHKVGAWTPRKPERPTTPETSDQPVVRQQPAPTSQPSAQTVAPRLVEQFPGELEEIFPSTRWFALMVGDRVVALVTTHGDQVDSVLLLSADRRHTVAVDARDGYFPGSIAVTDERDAENPYTISDNDADGVPDRKMTGLPRSFRVFELDSINWRPKVRAKDAATTQPSVEQP